MPKRQNSTPTLTDTKSTEFPGRRNGPPPSYPAPRPPAGTARHRSPGRSASRPTFAPPPSSPRLKAMRSKSASHRSVRGFADPQSFGSLDTHISTLDSRARENLLREAAARGDVASVTLLVARGVDMNAADPAGWSALHSAADGGHEQVVQELLNAGAKTDNQNEDSLTALDLSIVQVTLFPPPRMPECSPVRSNTKRQNARAPR